MIRIGKISYWHVHAEEYTQQVLDNPHSELAAIWDEDPVRGEQKAAQYGVPFIADLDELLQREDIDAVVVDAPTNLHHEVMVKAARAGKHIFTEKVIAPTLQEVNEIMNEVAKAGVRMAVSLPRLYEAYTLAIQEVLDSGRLGKLTEARVRLSHNGAIAGWLPAHFYSKEQCGGGAMIDLGCHPMYLVRLFLGMPEQVSAVFGYVTGKEVEDNAVVILGYGSGAVGIVEAGFVNARSPFSVEIHGTEGSLLFGLPQEKILVSSSEGSGWDEVEAGDRLPIAFDQWITHIQEGKELNLNLEIARDLTSLMEAANLSAQEHRAVRINELKG
ncbi:Gfo/Idh/MocA family protein [Paenibacillus tuaregi]|uniref:Gfo/Idh/MocA family protein n=1 Tax=Paenibacillus tuaregi TaxID=1816681 RepID=UPI0008396EA0|nr:Gfo/Idh/MocA family oxidoreductase [Paenibacillus tuaregi]